MPRGVQRIAPANDSFQSAPLVGFDASKNAAILMVAAAAFKHFVKITGDYKQNDELSRTLDAGEGGDDGY